MATPNGPRSCAITGRLAALALLALLTAKPAAAGRVDAADYQAFWLWSGVKPQAVLDDAREVYLLAGEVAKARQVRLVSQRSAIPHLAGKDVWIVYRAQTLEWTRPVYGQVFRQIGQWQDAGNHIAGLQIDFDSGTRNLERYVRFLKELRQQMPDGLRLSITGLLDWSANASAADLASLRDVVDEIVLQTYQGRRTIADYGTYLKRLSTFNVPFRIGLLQDGEWQAMPEIAAHPLFRGHVVFLVNPVK